MTQTRYLRCEFGTLDSHEIVTIQEPFEQRDCTGVVRRLAYTDHVVAKLTHLTGEDFAGIGGPAGVSPAYGNAAYLSLSGTEVEMLLSLQARRSNAAAEAAAVRRAARDEAISVLDAIPPACRAELDEARRAHARHWAGINGGGEGYVPECGWHGPTGREIAARHGLDADRIARALDAIETA